MTQMTWNRSALDSVLAPDASNRDNTVLHDIAYNTTVTLAKSVLYPKCLTHWPLGNVNEILDM